MAERGRAVVEEVEQVEKKAEMGLEKGDEEEEEQQDFTFRVEEIPCAREIMPCERSATTREKVEREGREVVWQ